MDEKDLKNLLDEALTYKNPRDANEKSETFKVSQMIASFLLSFNKQQYCLNFFNDISMAHHMLSSILIKTVLLPLFYYSY